VLIRGSDSLLRQISRPDGLLLAALLLQFWLLLNSNRFDLQFALLGFWFQGFILLWYLKIHPVGLPIGPRPLLWLYLLAIWMVLSLSWSVSLTVTTLYQTLPLLMVTASLFAIWISQRSVWLFRTLLWGIVAACLISALYAISQYHAGGQPNSLLLNKNNHAALMILALFITLQQSAALATQRRHWQLGAVVMAPFIYTILITGSRGAIIGYATALLLALVWLWRRHRTLFWLLIGINIALVLIIDNSRIDRIATIANTPLEQNISARYAKWEVALTMISQQPILGTGLGTFRLTYPALLDPIRSGMMLLVHNDYLSFAVELGLIGAALFGTLLVATLIQVIATLRRSEVEIRVKDEIVLLSLAILGLLIHTLVTFNLYVNAIVFLFYLLLGRLLFLTATGPIAAWRPATRRGKAMVGVLLLLPLAYFALLLTTEWQINRAYQAIARGEFEHAEQSLSRAVAIVPWYERSYRAVGDLWQARYQQQHEPEWLQQGVVSYQRCSAIVPLDIRCRSRLAALYRTAYAAGAIKSQQLEAAYQAIRRYDPYHLLTLVRYGEFLIDHDRRDEAIALLRDFYQYSTNLRAMRLADYQRPLQLMQQLGEDDIVESQIAQINRHRRYFLKGADARSWLVNDTGLSDTVTTIPTTAAP
jgi:O-antigen ligase